MLFLFTPDFLESRDAIVVCSVPCFFLNLVFILYRFSPVLWRPVRGGRWRGGGCGASGAGGGGGHLHASVEGTTRPSMG